MTTVLVPRPVPHRGAPRRGVAIASGLNGHLEAGQLHGLFAGDTRVLSTYRLTIHGQAWQLVGRSRAGHATALYVFQNPATRDIWSDLPSGVLFLGLRRRLAGALHDDLRLSSFAERRVQVQL